jgi:crotonobetainyl-CoA:carnitine CoA-transferase CaiB-like acyl-CoA transferase
MSAAPLAGIVVVDFSLYLPGPYATRLLGDLGAEVVKVEPPRGDPIRGFLPGVYEFLNRGKRVEVADLKSAEGLGLAQELISGADVVLEGFRPGVAERLGIGFDRAAELRPGLVYCSLSGYGQSGPERDRPGHDIGYEAGGGAYAGVLAIGDPPAPPHVAVGDLGGSLFAALSICASLVGRAAGGGAATHLDVSMQEAVVHLSATRWGRYLRDGVEPGLDDLASYAPGAGFFETADGHFVALASVEDKFWEGLCLALGRADLAGAPYDTHAGRMRHRGPLRDELAGAIALVPVDELERRLEAGDVPLDRVRSAAEVCADPHLLERGIIRALDQGLHLDFPGLFGGRRPGAPAPATEGAAR